MKFANIEEDTPSYHRRYDFFVSKFSSLCHNNNPDMETRNMLRRAGLNGLKGVIRKTVGDDLQADIWDEVHMEKIVPSLLYNMQDRQVIGTRPTITTTDGGPQQTLLSAPPAETAEECFKELLGRATFGHIHCVIKPVLRHLDSHNLWDARFPEDFASSTFKLIMHSIQSQHAYSVIQLLMAHLDEKSKSSSENEIKVKTGIVSVLTDICPISAAESIGPSVLEIINSLLIHLSNSINNSSAASAEEEQMFQEAVIEVLGQFANNVPDFQKIEIMMFIVGKIPPRAASKPTDILLQDILLKSLLKVSTTYKTVNMLQAFPSAFLNPLLSLSLSPDANIRLSVQRIFQQLLDRHNNLNRLREPVTLTPIPSLTMEKPYRQVRRLTRNSHVHLV